MNPVLKFRAWLAARREAKQKARMRARLYGLAIARSTWGRSALS